MKVAFSEVSEDGIPAMMIGGDIGTGVSEEVYGETREETVLGYSQVLHLPSSCIRTAVLPEDGASGLTETK